MNLCRCVQDSCLKSCDPVPPSSGMNLASWNQDDNLDKDTQDLFSDSPVKVRGVLAEILKNWTDE